MPDARVGVRPAADRRRRLGDPEIDDAARWPAVDLGHQDVGGLEVAMDDAAQVRVLHTGADLREQREPLGQRQVALVAVARDRNATHVLHREIRTAIAGRPGIQDAGDVRVREHGQRLALELEARNDFARAQAELEHLERDLPPHRLPLLGQEHLAHRALAEALQDPVRADRPRHRERRQRADSRVDGRRALVVRGEQAPDAFAQCRIRAGGQEQLALRRSGLHATIEQRLFGLETHPSRRESIFSWSQARANAQSRFAVAGEMPRATAVSSMLMPAK
jgi:hypothetical protein